MTAKTFRMEKLLKVINRINRLAVVSEEIKQDAEAGRSHLWHDGYCYAMKQALELIQEEFEDRGRS